MKRRKVFITIIILLLVFTAFLLFEYKKARQPGSAAFNDTPKIENPIVKDKEKLVLDGIRIVLDPGHGGRDIGASGQKGTIEKDITLKTAIKIKSGLEQVGADVKITRDGDNYTSLDDRVEMAAKHQADLFISIHYDAFETNDVHGMTSYYYRKEDQKIAEYIHQQIFKVDISTRNRGVSFGDYYVLRENKVPAVLLELGYLSNAEDEALINTDDFQNKVTTGIVEGVIRYYSR